ncbi:MAG TPA: hypothetical protein VF976_02645 [Gemmatimonadales bacterium]
MVTTLTLRPRWLKLTLTALMAMVVVACGSGATAIDPSALAGTWVGENIVMTVTDSGAQLEMPCAHGDIAGALAQNPFSVGGTFGREFGPAVDDHPALYTGRVVGATMTLDIRLTDTNESVGSFTLTRGTPGRLVKCV